MCGDAQKIHLKIVQMWPNCKGSSINYVVGRGVPPYRNDYGKIGGTPHVTTTVNIFGRVLFSVALGGTPYRNRNVVVTVGGYPPKGYVVYA